MRKSEILLDKARIELKILEEAGFATGNLERAMDYYLEQEIANRLEAVVIPNLRKDAERYRWLRKKYSEGDETYLAEGITSGIQLDEYIDKQITV